MATPYRLALISNQAFSIINFRGPLVREMVENGMTVFALAPDYTDDTRAAVRALGATPVDSSLSRAGMNPFRDAVDLFRLSLQLSRLHLDATFAYFIKPVIYGTLAARLAGVPRRLAMIEGAGYVFTHDEHVSLKRRSLRLFVSKLYTLGLSQAHRVFLLNSDDKKLFVDMGMVAEEKIQLLDGIGIDLVHYEAASPVTQPVCFILIARLLREKGVYEYIDAARRTKAANPEVRFLLVGDVDHNPGSISEAEARSWSAEGVVEWPGHVTDVREWLKQASVFVLPSYREGLPRSTQEAMAMARAVVTTDVPGCRATVSDGVNGFVVPARNSHALEKAMLKFIEQPELITSMGKMSRELAERRFNVHAINAQILAVVKNNCVV